MLGEIYITINDLKEENELLRKEKYNLLITLNIIEKNNKERINNYENLCSYYNIELGKKESQIIRLERNINLLETNYLLKCDELKYEYNRYITIQQNLQEKLEFEKKKRKNQINSLKYQLLSKSSLNQLNNKTNIITYENKNNETSLLTTNNSNNNQNSPRLQSSPVVTVSNNHINDRTSIVTTNLNSQGISSDLHIYSDSLQINQTYTDVSNSNESIIQESSDMVLKLITERNYWKNQTYSLRKEFKSQSKSSSSSSSSLQINSIKRLKQSIYNSLPLQKLQCTNQKCSQCTKLYEINEQLHYYIQTLLSEVEIFIHENQNNQQQLSQTITTNLLGFDCNEPQNFDNQENQDNQGNQKNQEKERRNDERNKKQENQHNNNNNNSNFTNTTNIFKTMFEWIKFCVCFDDDYN